MKKSISARKICKPTVLIDILATIIFVWNQLLLVTFKAVNSVYGLKDRVLKKVYLKQTCVCNAMMAGMQKTAIAKMNTTMITMITMKNLKLHISGALLPCKAATFVKKRLFIKTMEPISGTKLTASVSGAQTTKNPLEANATTISW